MRKLSLLFAASCATEYHAAKPIPVYAHADNPGDLPFEWVTDRLSVPQQKVDVVFVVDDSFSMEDDQVRLSENAPRLIEPLQQAPRTVDYHLGVITTDCVSVQGCGAFVGTASSSDFDVEESLARLLLVGTGGSGNETGGLAMWYALTLQDDQSDFFRDDASLHFVVLSDEEDKTSDMALEVGLYPSLEREADRRPLVSVSTITGGPSTALSCNAAYGRSYIELAERFGGEVVDICDEDWGEGVDRIAETLAKDVPTFYLSRNPIDVSIQVYVEREDLVFAPERDEWSFLEEQNAIRFRYSYSLQPYDVVVIEYQQDR